MARAQTLKLIYGVERDPMMANLETIPAWTAPPQDPPVDWFTDEAADEAPERLRFFPSGKVAGVVAPAGRCLLDGSNTCWMVPRPPDGRGSVLASPGQDAGDYYMAHPGETVVDLGSGDRALIGTATLAGPGGHADPYASIRETREHYDRTELQIARGRYVWSDKAGGVVFVGALMPKISEPQMVGIRASAVSVDYRWVNDESRYRLIAACQVNAGAFPSRYAGLTDSGFVVTPSRTIEIAQEMGLVPVSMTASLDDSVAFDAWNQIEKIPLGTPGPIVIASAGVPSRIAAPSEEPMSDTSVAAPVDTSTATTPTTTPAAGNPVSGPPTEMSHSTVGGTTHIKVSHHPGHPDEPGVTGCVDCADAAMAAAPPAKAAAFQVQSIPTADSLNGPSAAPGLTPGDQVTWGSGDVGMYSDTMAAFDGSPMLVVFEDEGGLLEMDEPVIVPADKATQTGKMYSYVDAAQLPLDNMVIPENFGQEADTPEERAEDAVYAKAGEDNDETSSEAPMMASLGARIRGNRVVVGKPLTPIEARLAAIESATQRALAEKDAQIAGLRGDVSALTGATSAMIEVASGMHQKDLAATIASL